MSSKFYLNFIKISSKCHQMSLICHQNVRLKCALGFGIKWCDSVKLVWPISMMYLNFSCGRVGGWGDRYSIVRDTVTSSCLGIYTLI